MKVTVFWRLASSTTWPPALAMPAPATPPMMACDDDVGRPRHHVSRFQPMAPARPAKITAGLTTSRDTVWPTVSATAVRNTRKATKLNTAAHRTAALGDSTRVATIVDTELAASWNPLVKSNAQASATMALTASAV